MLPGRRQSSLRKDATPSLPVEIGAERLFPMGRSYPFVRLKHTPGMCTATLVIRQELLPTPAVSRKIALLVEKQTRL